MVVMLSRRSSSLGFVGGLAVGFALGAVTVLAIGTARRGQERALPERETPEARRPMARVEPAEIRVEVEPEQGTVAGPRGPAGPRGERGATGAEGRAGSEPLASEADDYSERDQRW
jgi:hypothetical protein